MPRKFLSKITRVIKENTEEWLYFMDEPGVTILRIYLKDERVHFAEYELTGNAIEVRDKDEEAVRDCRGRCLFDIDVDIQNTVDGIVTEFSLYENGNGCVLYEEHWGTFPAKEFEELKEYAFQLEEKAGEYDGLLCTTFLK